MRKLPPVALAVTGKIMRSFVLDLPGFRERIGPVKASSLRVASRITNTLHAGFPVSDYGDFEPCRAILLCLSDPLLPEVVDELVNAPLDWAGRTVILSESRLSSEALRRLASCGAYTATMDIAPEMPRMVVAEGHRRALAELKPMLGRAARLIRIEAQHKPRFYRGLSLADLCGPMAALAGEELKAAGLSPAQAKPVVEAVFLKAVREYVKSGRKVLSNAPDPRRTELLRKLVNSV